MMIVVVVVVDCSNERGKMIDLIVLRQRVAEEVRDKIAKMRG